MHNESTKKRECIKGLGCGMSCIAKTKVCRQSLSSPTNKMADSSAKLIQSISSASSDLKMAPNTVLGQGAFGKVIYTKSGTALKELFIGEISEYERDAAQALSDAGIGPKLIKANKKSIELEYLDDYTTMSKVFYSKANLGTSTSPEAISVFGVLGQMHKLGWAHGDAHSGNFMINKSGKVKVIDTGESVKLSDKDGVKVWAQEIHKLWPDKDIKLKDADAGTDPKDNAYRRAMHKASVAFPMWLSDLKDSDLRDIYNEYVRDLAKIV